MDILDVLVSQGKIDQNTASKLRIDSITQGKDIDKIIEDSSLVSEADFYEAKAKVFNVPFKDVRGLNITKEIFNIIEENDLKSHIVLPFDRKDNKVLLVMANPLDVQLIQYLSHKYSIEIEPYLGISGDILSIIDNKSSAQIEGNVIEEVEAADVAFKVDDTGGDIGNLGNLAGSIENAPIVKIINTVLEYAVKFRASDIHIEPEKKSLRFRFRIDGILQEKLSVPSSLSSALVSRIKILSRLKIDEKRIPQDGRFNIKVGKEIVDLRVSTLPIIYGEKVVIRLLRKTGGIAKIEDLGLEGDAFDKYKRSLNLTKGIILITGPTGSGKTQTLASSISAINSDAVNILTLEDPVEIEIDGVNQVQINPDVGLTFADGLRAFLRQDPNVIMVGEIRDEETARLATQASLTGHLVFSTIHTTSAAGALPRLLDMGIEPFLISSTIELIVAQRLVRKLCNVCAEKYQATKSIIDDISKILQDTTILSKYFKDDNSVLYLKKAKGCNSCDNTGYLGRIGIFEVLTVTDNIREMILNKSSSDQIDDQSKKDGMISLVQDGMLKVLDEVTTLEEVYRVAREEI